MVAWIAFAIHHSWCFRYLYTRQTKKVPTLGLKSVGKLDIIWKILIHLGNDLFIEKSLLVYLMEEKNLYIHMVSLSMPTNGKAFLCFQKRFLLPVFRQLKGCSKYWSGAGVVQLQCSFWAIILKWTRYNIEFNDPLKYKLCSSDILQNAAASLQDNPFWCRDTFPKNYG